MQSMIMSLVVYAAAKKTIVRAIGSESARLPEVQTRRSGA
jgi:hypothetical protein